VRVEAAERAEEHLAAHAGRRPQLDDLRDLQQLIAQRAAGERRRDCRVVAGEHRVQRDRILPRLIRRSRSRSRRMSL
jgi:hypothetical protein